MSTIVLSRYLITGQATDLPSCVLSEIEDAHGPHVVTISCNPTRDELCYIARFVNRDVSSWQPKTLLTAFKFLQFFMRETITLDAMLTRIGRSFRAGLQTPELCANVNACVLYRICKTASIPTNSATTIDTMERAVRLLFEDTGSLRRQLNEMLDTRRIPRTQLISVLMHTETNHPPVTDPFYVPQAATTHGALEMRIRQHIHNLDYLRSIADVKNVQMAVALAAYSYELDISKVADPIWEYYALKDTCHGSYVPHDAWMRYWWKKNPAYFHLSHTFNPVFPVDYYKSDKLHEMALSAGYTDIEIEASSAYELLCKAAASVSVYEGEYPTLRTTTTDGLSYGVLDQQLTGITMQEIEATMQSVSFSRQAIRKLRSILTRRDRQDVLAVVDSIQRRREFNEKYRVCAQGEKEAIVVLFNRIEQLGKLASKEPRLDEVAVEIASISEHLSMHPVCSCVMDLPIEGYGRTIGELLAMIAEGDEREEACLESASPWLLTSVKQRPTVE
jgi:hypothetical protein